MVLEGGVDTKEQIEAAIPKAMKNEPEGPNRDYWTTGFSHERIKEKYD